MSSRTTNLNLEKPANSDYVDVDVINSNSDKIDTFAGQVLNGSYVQDSNYVHTDNNFTSTLKDKLNGVEANANNYSLPTASTGTLGGVKVDGSTITIDSNGIISSTGGGGGGTTVIANPSGTATAALEKLQVGQTIYSSGGTTVIGNPSGTATADLEKIQIGNTIYSVSSGGGGGTGSGKTLVKKTKTYTGDGQIPLVVTFDEKPLLVYSIYGPGLNESNTVRMYPFVYGETKASGRYINNDSSSGLIGYTIAYSNNDLTMSITSNPGDAGACLNNNGSSFTITYLVEENASSGHTILNDSGTALSQENNLQFKGVYSHDDSTNGKTVVEVTRTMTLAQYQALSSDEKKGVIAVTDDSPEPYYTDVVGTLVAGSTSITLSDASITTNSTIDLYTDTYGVNPLSISVSTGSITLTFAAQQGAVNVKVRVS